MRTQKASEEAIWFGSFKPGQILLQQGKDVDIKHVHTGINSSAYLNFYTGVLNYNGIFFIGRFKLLLSAVEIKHKKKTSKHGKYKTIGTWGLYFIAIQIELFQFTWKEEIFKKLMCAILFQNTLFKMRKYMYEEKIS